MITRLARLSFLAAVVIAGSTGPEAASMPMPQQPDLAIRETDAGLQVFVADPKRGRLMFGSAPPGRRAVGVVTMTPFTPCGPLEGAVTVAVRDARLVVASSEPPAVTECDLNTGRTVVVHKGEPLRVPASVAIAADGSIAVLDRVLRGIVMLRRDARPTVIKTLGSPMLIRADDLGQLFVVDSESRGIVPVDYADNKGFAASSSSPAQQSPRTGPLLSLSVEPASFAAYRDVFYVAEVSGALRAQVPGGRISLEVPDVRPRQAAVAASRNHLAMIDFEGSMVEIIDRPLPAALLLDPTDGNPNEAWLQLLEYVGERRLLSRDRVAVTPEDTSYEALLARTGVLLKSDVNPRKLAVQPGRADRLFCLLNPTVCATGFSPRLTVVVIPQASPQPVLQTESVVLGGRDAKGWINERVLLSSHMKEVTDSYLTTRNPSVAATLDNELLRRNMAMATPMDGRLVAGTIIRIVNGREIVVAQVASMCDGMSPTTAKTSLQTRLLAPPEAVPAVTRVPPGDRTQMEVGAWLRSTVPITALAKCRWTDQLYDAYVIIESLGVLATSFSPVQPANDRPTASVHEGPYYVGYKAVPISALAAGVAVPTDAERLKPMPKSAPSALWNLTSGSLTLPVTRWRTDVLVPTPEFYGTEGPLRLLLQQHRSIDLSPRERLRLSALTSHSGSFIQDGNITEKIEKSQQQLVDAITYDEKLANASGTEDVFIGIVEQPGSVNQEHPGFVSDDKSAWFDFVDGAGALQPHQVRAGQVALKLRRADKDAEHGTHVAGIIAARQKPSVGMLPKTRLFLVPSNSMATLKQWIQTARDNFVYIFNLSQGFPSDTPQTQIQDLHKNMKDSWKDALFVVAAGNDSADLNASGALAPVAWSFTLPNVLTVGALDQKGENILGHHRDSKEEEEERKGSNFGSQYVDLVAPGQMIHSLGKDGYAYACGSSHAAPQVTATAAMLWAHSTKPEVVRARLIYTADWKDANFDKKVWGGLLNMKRAVFAPKSNVFTRSGDDKTPYEIKFPTTATVHIDGEIQNRIGGGTTQMRDEKFPFGRVLRIEAMSDGRSRVVLLSRGGVLTIVKGTIKGMIKCDSLKRYDTEGERFSLEPDPPVNCQTGVSVGGMFDYVAAMPAAVAFH